MKLSNIEIDFAQSRKTYEATLSFSNPNEAQALYNEFRDFQLDGYDEGEITLSIDAEVWGYTKEELFKELRIRLARVKRNLK
jgi:hypothetical protein